MRVIWMLITSAVLTGCLPVLADSIGTTCSGPVSSPPQVASSGIHPVVISDVPAYSWYHGCAPTAAASLIGYWDLHGYPNLFDAAGPQVFYTPNVQDQISSPAHNAKYDPTPDNPNLPTPPSTSIADFFHTSQDPLGYGWTYNFYADSAFTGYAAYRGYHFSAFDEYFYGDLSWNTFTSEIDAGRPVMFIVDTSGTGSTDHAIPVIGYEDRGAGGLWYGMYTTWSEDETVVWEPFRGIQPGVPWGIASATFVRPLDNPIPEPASIVLIMLAGILGISFRRFMVNVHNMTDQKDASQYVSRNAFGSRKGELAPARSRTATSVEKMVTDDNS